MLLIELFLTESEDAELQHLINNVRKAKEELRDAKQKAASFQQSGSSSAHKNTIDRLEAAVKTAQAKVDAYQSSRGEAEKARAAEKERATKRAAETPEEKSARHGAAISAGRAHAKEIKTGESGKAEKTVAASKVYDYVNTSTNGGKDKISTSDIAHHFDTTVRTVNKWLEQPEFTKVARLLGRR